MLTPSTDPGVIASATFDLSATPEYIPPFQYCDRRKVCFELVTTLTGGTQNNIVDLEGEVFYGPGNNQTYPIAEKSDPVTILAGQIVGTVLKFCTDLDKDRIVRISLRYASGVTPPPGAGVTYTVPVPATPNLTACLYCSEQYPPEKKDEFCGCPVVKDNGDCKACEKKESSSSSSSSSSEEDCGCRDKKHHDHGCRDKKHHRKSHHKKRDCGKCHGK